MKQNILNWNKNNTEWTSFIRWFRFTLILERPLLFELKFFSFIQFTLIVACPLIFYHKFFRNQYWFFKIMSFKISISTITTFLIFVQIECFFNEKNFLFFLGEIFFWLDFMLVTFCPTLKQTNKWFFRIFS